MKIGNLEVGRDHRPVIVAELSGNHNQSIELALKLIEAAAEAGVQAVKFQTYTPDTMTLNLDRDEFLISDPGSLWHGRTLYDLYREAHTPWEWHEQLFKRSRELGLVPFSTPFDDTAVDFLEKLDAPCYKIASFENTDIPLIRKAAQTGKPLLISTGMATEDELAESVTAAREAGCRDLMLLKCTSAYPSTESEANLSLIPRLLTKFKVEVGLSDHSLGIAIPLVSVALGASLIEKHFVLSRKEEGVDAAFSLEPAEMKLLVTESEKAWQALGKDTFVRAAREEKSVQYRRSLYVVADIKAGEKFTRLNVRAIRPGFGLPPGEIDQLLGRTAAMDCAKGTPLSWGLIEGGNNQAKKN